MFPTMSVSVIGLIIGATWSLRWGRPWVTLIVGLVGAWIGFVAGAAAALIMDVLFATGTWLAVVGHLMAGAGALVAVRWQTMNSLETPR